MIKETKAGVPGRDQETPSKGQTPAALPAPQPRAAVPGQLTPIPPQAGLLPAQGCPPALTAWKWGTKCCNDVHWCLYVSKYVGLWSQLSRGVNRTEY